MSILSETVISTLEAARMAHVTRSAIRTWITKGTSGVKLEAVYVGDRLKTSKEALERFLNALNKLKMGA